MRILYDHQIFSSQVYGGISRYFYELLLCFSETAGIDFQLALHYSNNSYLSHAGFSKHSNFFPGRSFTGKTTLLAFFNGLRSRSSLLKGDYEVFHPTYYNPYFLKHLKGRPYVMTVYDMVHELFPEQYTRSDSTREWKRQSLNGASKVIAISENTRQDVVRIYGLDEQKVEVIHLASSLRATPDTALLPVSGDYFLYVGLRLRYKNFFFFIRAAAPIMRQNRDLTIVCVGGGSFSPEESALFESLGIEGQVRQMSVPDETLAAIYGGARAFIFPSLYEGFGIPILEAFSCGCPVILAQSSCFPEIAGQAALYFDPKDEAALRVVLERVLGDENLRGDLRGKGYLRGNEFSWDKTASRTRAVYEGLS